MIKTMKEIIALVESNKDFIHVKQDLQINVTLHVSYTNEVVAIPIEGKLICVYFSQLGNEQLLTMELSNNENPIYLDYNIDYDYLMLAMNADGEEWNDTLDERQLPNDVLKQILDVLKQETLKKC